MGIQDSQTAKESGTGNILKKKKNTQRLRHVLWTGSELVGTPLPGKQDVLDTTCFPVYQPSNEFCPLQPMTSGLNISDMSWTRPPYYNGTQHRSTDVIFYNFLEQ